MIKIERNSFRIQLSARDIAIYFASAQPKPQVSVEIGLSLSLSAVQTKVTKSNSNHSGIFLATCK